MSDGMLGPPTGLSPHAAATHASAGDVARSLEDGRLLSVRIADDIRRAVLDGEMLPGMRVGQEWLAAKFGASRIPVREALQQLQSEGLVVLAPNRGARIADVTSQESIEVYKIREVLEPLAIAESVPLLTDEDIAALDASMRRLEQVGRVEDYIPLDREFHLLTYSRAPMPHLRDMIERYWNSTQHFRRWFVKDSLAKDGLPFSDPQHLMLMEAIRSRDADAASALVRLHIRRTRLLIETMVTAATPSPATPARRRARRENRPGDALATEPRMNLSPILRTPAPADAYDTAAQALRRGSTSTLSEPAADAATALSLFAAADRAAPALIYFDRTLSYGELDRFSDRLAAWLQRHGVGRGDRVATLLQNTPQFVIVALAAWKLAATLVPLNPMYRVPELARLFADCRPGAVVCHDDQWSAAVEACAGIVDPACLLWASPRELQSRDDARVLPAPPQVPAPGSQSLAAVLAMDVGTRPGEPSNPAADDVAVLLYTSGTTGLPKGAMLTHRNLVFNGHRCAAHFGLTPASRLFGIAPLFHVTGLEVQMIVAFAAGASVVLTHRFQPAVVLDAFLEHRPTFVIGAITVFIALMNRAETTPAHFASFAHLYSGGAPIAPATVQAFAQRFGRDIRTSYGMTELTAPSHLAPNEGRIPVDPASGALSIGRLQPGIDALIVDDSGAPLGPREPGELVVRGPSVMAGYWGKPDETAQALRAGWMHTGDIGFVDEDGWFYLIDRKKDMISASGFKVWPREVEDVLYAFAGVREAGVVGAPDDYRGETVVAFVSAVDGTTLDLVALNAHCRERLAAYKCPVAIHVVDELPKTETGKITRAVLAARLKAGAPPPS